MARFLCKSDGKSSNILNSRAYVIPTPVNGNKFKPSMENSFVSYQFYTLNMISEIPTVLINT
ncbi:hypothetical protein SAMN05421827_102120 [Pedobacter terrae]|uniref:Uncharacterized protein n=1 Tax=Pedobacter terrae TaxID=405671 RepID=A0A1G7Q0W3_9SPHI|nr:hypothetical protein SAMN05421827_102120 [Pedobacter terrae]